MSRKLVLSFFSIFFLLFFTAQSRAEADVCLDDVQELLQSGLSLDLKGLWKKIGTEQDQGQDLLLEEGTWDFELLAVGASLSDPALPVYKVLRIYDNQKNNWLLFFVFSGGKWVYFDRLEFPDQKKNDPGLKSFALGDELWFTLAETEGRCGQRTPADILSFYFASDGGLRPVLSCLKNGYVRGGESGSDRKYVLNGYSALGRSVLQLTYSVEYYGDAFAYSYDQRWEQDDRKMLLNTVEKKACFLWDEDSFSFVYDQQLSTLAEEDKEALLCAEK